MVLFLLVLLFLGIGAATKVLWWLILAFLIAAVAGWGWTYGRRRL